MGVFIPSESQQRVCNLREICLPAFRLNTTENFCVILQILYSLLELGEAEKMLSLCFSQCSVRSIRTSANIKIEKERGSVLSD